MREKRSGTRYKLPYDVKQETLWIVRGYERRKREYQQARRAIFEESGGGRDGGRGGSDTGRPVERTQERLEELERAPETERMRAVERALLAVGADLPAGMRRQLKKGLMLNCQDRKSFPFDQLELPGLSRKEFYKRKETFLTDIAAFLRLF